MGNLGLGGKGQFLPPPAGICHICIVGISFKSMPNADCYCFRLYDLGYPSHSDLSFNAIERLVTIVSLITANKILVLKAYLNILLHCVTRDK